MATPAPEVQVVAAPASAPAAESDATDYATREAQDKQVANFQGGSTVIIGISGGALLVLLFFLLLI